MVLYGVLSQWVVVWVKATVDVHRKKGLVKNSQWIQCEAKEGGTEA